MLDQMSEWMDRAGKSTREALDSGSSPLKLMRVTTADIGAMPFRADKALLCRRKHLEALDF